MTNIKEDKQYIMQKSAEIKVYDLFRDFKSNLDNFNNHLSLMLKYKKKIPSDSLYYRARVIGTQTYKDLSVVSNGNDNFKLIGFPSEKMMAPPKGKGEAGRANKSGESFLYLSSDPEVCCSEVRPIFTDMISVIKFRLLKDITVLDFKSIDCSSIDMFEKEIYKRIMIEMVEPKKEQTDDSYKLTQHISAYFKSKDIDGIKYGTLNSNNQEHFNLALFDESNVIPDGESEVYRVISKASKFQNITDKEKVIGVSNGYEKLEMESVEEIILKIKRLKG